MKKTYKSFAALMTLSLLMTGPAVLADETGSADAGSFNNSSSGPLITYNFNGGQDTLTLGTADYFRPGRSGSVVLYDPYNVSCGNGSVFLGWKKESEYDNPAAKLYVDKIKHNNYIYDIKDNETVSFKALWGKKVSVPVYAGEGFAFMDAEGNKCEKIDLDCVTNSPYGVDFTSSLPGQAIYSNSQYEGKSEYWLLNPYMDFSRRYILDGFVSSLTGQTYSLNDSYFPAEGDSLEAVWVKACRIYINYNGGENIRLNMAQEHTADVVKEDKTYYTYFNNPSRKNTLESRDDKYIVKPGYRFTGWKNSYDGKIYSQNDTFVPNRNTIFTAIWEKCDGDEDRGPYSALRTVRYEANGGSFRDESSGRLLSAEDHRYRAYFWNLRCRADGYTEYDTEDYVFNKTIKVGFFNGDTTNASDYVMRHPYDRLRFATSAEYDNYINDVLTSNCPFLVYRSGYKFMGWDLKGDNSEHLYQNGETFDPHGKDVTFVAQWEKVD